MGCFSKRTGMKKKYYDKQEAIGRCKKLEEQSGHPMNIYLCDKCGAYHIGQKRHKKKEFKRKIRSIIDDHGGKYSMINELYELFLEESKVMNYNWRYLK